MAKKYNGTHVVQTFKIGDIVTVAISAKDRAVTDPPRMEAKIIGIPHENRYRLKTEYGTLTNFYPTSELNLVPRELLDSVLARMTTSKNSSLTMTLHAAAALRSPASHVPVKCGCKNKCDTRRCNCVKAKVQCTQYYHSGHLNCSNLPSTIAEQTEIPIVSRSTSHSKRKRGELTPAKSTKKPLINQAEPPPRMRGLQPTSTTSLPTRARTGKTLAHYLNTAGVAAQLSSIRPRTSSKKGKIPKNQTIIN